MTEPKTIELEIVNSTDDKLVRFADKTGLEKPATATLVEAFRPIFAKARAAIEDAHGVAESVKDATCVKEIRKSRACRLALRAVRLESEAARKKQKEHALLYGRAVDGFHNILLADLSPVETALQDAEGIAERAEAARKAALKVTREAELNPILETPFMGDLSDLSETVYAKTLADAKLLRQTKIDAAARVEAERIAREEQYQKEREENARLKVEAEKREAAAKAEREAAEKKLAAERAAAEATAKAAAEKARKEREAIEAKARAERAAAEAAARKEQQRLEAIAAEERKKVVAAEAKAKALRDAEAKRVADAAAAAAEKKWLAEVAAKKAAAAPDNAKAQAFADLLRGMPLPKFTGQAWALLPSKIEGLAAWIESQISKI
jgi:colicin import membrane protein